MELELLSNNGNCKLPCFLSMSPGQTKQQEAINFLHMFASISFGPEIVFPKDNLLYSLSVVPQGGYNGEQSIVKWIDVDIEAYRKLPSKLEKIYDAPYYSQAFKYYMLPLLLTNYGKPDNVYIFLDTGIADMGLGQDLYLLHLDYPKLGFVAHFEMPLHHQDTSLVGCPNEAFTKLRLWSPKEPSRDYELDASVLFTIKEATGMSIEEFYQRFKNLENTSCLETPADIHK